MGYYINHNSEGQFIGTSFKDKLSSLIKDGAIAIDDPKEFKENLVCIVDNGPFAAAAYAYSEEEMNVFLNHTNGRRTQWLSYAHAKDLAQ